MKKKILMFLLLAVGLISFSACGSTKIDLSQYLIEKRTTLYTAEDELYSVTFSSGTREQDYELDGIVGEMIDFGIVTLSRLDNAPLADDTYTYTVQINDQTYTGFLEKSSIDNSYLADIGACAPADAIVKIQITFTGYSFNEELSNTSNLFSVDVNRAIEIANESLKEELNNITSDKNNKIEVVVKNLKDYSNNEVKNYYWYVGVISTNGDTLGILIDASTGDVIAKKV